MEEEDLKRKKKSLTDRSRLAEASNDLATYYYKHDRYSDALCEYQLQLSIYAELGLQMEWAACHRMIGEMYLSMAEFAKAIKFVKHHLSVAKELNDVLEELMALETLGRIYLVQGESLNKEESKTSLEAAENAFMAGLALCETYRNQTSKSKKHDLLDIQVRILLEIGEVQVQLGFIDKGIEFIEKAITICLNEDFYEVLHKCFTTMASLHRCKNDYAKALSFLNRALEVSSRLEEKDQKICEALTTKAEILCKMSDYRGAKKALLKAWKLKTPEKERKNIESDLKTVIAMCDTEDLLKSSDTSDHTTLKKLYDKLGDGACCLKNYAAAADYYFKELEHAELAGDCGKTLGPIYFSLYKTYKDMGCYNEALVYCEKEYELYKDEPQLAIVSLHNIAEVLYLARKPYHLIEKACIDARDAAKKINKKQYETIILNRLLFCQESYGETDKMTNTKLELEALGHSLEKSEDARSSDGGDVSDTDTTCIGDDVCLEDLPDLSDTEDMEVAEKKKETKNFTITKNSKGDTTSLHRACQSGNIHHVDSLLAGGYPVNQRDNAGWLPLHEACLYGRLEIATMLINSGADVNDKGGPKCHGTTPLHDAASNGHLDVVQLLLAKGAIPSVKSYFNETPLDVLQKWRSNQNKLTKEKEIIYKYICNEINNFIEKGGGVDYDTSHSKIPMKPIKHISLPSISKSSNNIQDIIIIDDSDEEIVESQNSKNQSALATNDTNKNKITKLVVKAKKIKKERNAWVCYDIDVNTNISNPDNCQGNENTVPSEVIASETTLKDGMIQNTGGIGCDTTSKSKTHVKLTKDTPLPSTSKMISTIQESQIKNNQTVLASENRESPDDQSSYHPISDSKNSNSSIIIEEKVNKSLLALTLNDIGNDKLVKDKDKKKQKDKKIKHSKRLTVTKEPPLDKHKNSGKNPKKSKKQTKSRIRPDVSVNEKSCNSDNITKSGVMANQSMLNTSREMNDSLIIRTNNGDDFDILKSKHTLKTVKDLSRLTTSNKSKIQDFLIFDDSLDSDEFPVVDVKNSKPASLAPNDMVGDLDTTKKSNPVTVFAKNPEKINTVTKLLDKDNVFSDVIADKSMLNISREVNDNLVDNNDGVDFDTSSPPLIDNISLPSTLEISSYIQELQNVKNQTTFSIEDTQSSDHQSVSDNAYRISSLKNKNASEFSEDDVNKSVPPVLLTPSDVDNEKLDEDLTKNKQNYKKKRKLSDPINVPAKKLLLENCKNSFENVNKMSKALIESKKNTKLKKPRVSDNVDVTQNSSNSDNSQENKNMCCKVIQAESMLKTTQELNDSCTGGEFNFDTLESITRGKPIKETSQPSTSKISSIIPNKNFTIFPSEETDSLDAQISNHITEISGVKEYRSKISVLINKNASELPEDGINKPLPIQLTNSDMCIDEPAHDLGINKQNKMKKSKKNKENRKKRIENIHNIIEGLAKSKKITKSKQLQVNDKVDLNKNSSNSNNFQENHEVRSKVTAESMVNTSREFNDDLAKNTGSVDFNRSKPKSAANSILNMSLPSFSEISDYIQEIQNDINQTVFSKDTHFLNHLSVINETEISDDEDFRSATSASINRNISNFSEGERNKSITTLFSPCEVSNDDSDDDLDINIQNKTKKKKYDRKNNGKLSDPLHVVSNRILSENHRDSIENVYKLIDPEVKSKKSTKEYKSQVVDSVGVSKNSIDAGSENLYPRIIAVKSLANCREEKISENYCNTNDGFKAVENNNSDTNHQVYEIQPGNVAQTSNMEAQIIQPATVEVHIEDEVELIPLDLDAINVLTISWLVEEVKCRYYKLKGTCPVFNLMTSEGAILFEDEPLHLVLSSLELYTCPTNIKTSPAEDRCLDSYDVLGIHDAVIQNSTDDVKLFLHNGYTQSTSPRAEPDKSPQPVSPHFMHEDTPQLISPQPESTHLEPQLPTASRPKYNESPKHTSPRSQSPHPTSSPKHNESLQPVSLAHPTSPECGFSGQALPSKSMLNSPTGSQDPEIQLKSANLDELELDDQTLQLLGVAPRTGTRLGPPVHKVVAKNWQEILSQGLQKEDTDQIMEAYSVPANCDLLSAPTLNPEVKATIHENTVTVDSSLMEQQKQLGLAISALGTAVNSILLNETSKQMILKPISDACRLLCDIHFGATETRRHNVITSANPELQHLLVNTVRGSQLFGDNVTETAKFILQSGEALINVPEPAFKSNISFNKPSTS